VLRDRWMTGGAHSVQWSGDDASGRPVPPGVYLCVLRSGDVTQSRKLVRMR